MQKVKITETNIGSIHILLYFIIRKTHQTIKTQIANANIQFDLLQNIQHHLLDMTY